MSERDYAPLSGACVRGLCDKIYDKRKFSGAEIEKMVKDFNDANNSSQIKKLLRVLGQDLMSSTYPNVKNGALMGLSSVAVGLGKDSVAYLPELIQPIIACFSEAESRVRYQATEALFNVVKIARGVILTHIPQVFGALARLAADPEPQVKQAAELLDRLLKDIVTDSPAFELAAFVPIVRERMYTRNAFARQFVLSWVAVLDAGPQLDLARHLPELLDGMFHMLADNMPEIRKMCEIQLNEFLRGIKKDPENVEFEAMINILITHAQSSDELVQLTALLWVREFVSLSGRGMSAHASGVLTATLPCLAHHDARRNIRETAAAVNMQLMRLIESEGGEGKEKDGDREGKDGEVEGKAEGEEKGVGEQKEGKVDVPALVEVLTALLQHNSVHTKVAALDWILHLYNKLPAQMSLETERIFPRAVAALTDGADDVVRRALAVLAEICSCHHQPGDLESSPYYYKLLRALLRLLAADEALLEDRGAFIIRQLCVLLSAEDVYSALASILVKERDLRFVSTVVHVLSTLLLTAAELYHLRLRLRRLRRDDDISNASTVRLFTSLYRCWCHSPVSLVALCLLTHNYQHCNQLLTLFGDLEITVDLLTEIDQLVQLIESPIFAYMRLELLSGGGSLRSALYALLMLLPQSDAFHALRRRLQCAPTHAVSTHSSKEDQSDLDIDFSELLEEFKRVQDAHRQHRMLERSLHTAS